MDSSRKRSLFADRISGVIKGLGFLEEVVICLRGAYLSRRHFSVFEKIERKESSVSAVVV